MMVYASLVLPERMGPTRTQEKKFISSVSQPQLAVDTANGAVDRLTSDYRMIRIAHRIRGYCRKVELPPPPLAEVYITQRKGARNKKEADAVARQINQFLTGSAFQGFHAFPEVKAVLGDIGEDYFTLTHPWNGAHRDPMLVRHDDTEPIGVIGSSQEPGLKFRAFAAPSRVLQAALEPMKESLLSVLRLLPWDKTHDQAAGVTDVQNWLRQGMTVHSVDLSDATNNFPLRIQEWLLKEVGLFPATTIKLFSDVCKSSYKLMWDHSRTVKWNKGQPLGAGPSFMSFALAHASVALYAESLSGLEPSGETFRILGDDIVIANDEVHKQYRLVLQQLGCPVSESKCLSSAVAAEFAGKLVTQFGVYHGFKYREISDQSFMDVIRTLGRQALSKEILSPDQYEYAKLLESIPEPVGLGFNPKGIPLEQRWELYLHIKERLDLQKQAIPYSSVAEIRNKLRCQTQQPVWRYFEAERPSLSPKKDGRGLGGLVNLPKAVICGKDGTVPVPSTFPKSILEQIRGEELVPIRVETGDPRPKPQGLGSKKIRRVLDESEARTSAPPTSAPLDLVAVTKVCNEVRQIREKDEDPLLFLERNAARLSPTSLVQTRDGGATTRESVSGTIPSLG